MDGARTEFEVLLPISTGVLGEHHEQTRRIAAQSDTNFTAYLAGRRPKPRAVHGRAGLLACRGRAMEFVLTRQEATGQCRWRGAGGETAELILMLAAVGRREQAVGL